MPEIKTYTHVTLKDHSDPLIERFEIRVSTFIEYETDPGRRAVNKKPTKKRAEEIAKEIARSERIRTSG